ncbi:hypothetical protein ACRBEV_05155 [Methylobacterium phyllosphaerae]
MLIWLPEAKIHLEITILRRLITPVCVCALLIVSALPQSAASDPAKAPEAAKYAGSLALVGANVAACADANSDYERYELGCPADETSRAVAPELSGG